MSFDDSRAGFYHARAEEIRQMAEKTRDVTIKEQLERVAHEYDALAKMVEGGVLKR